MVRRTGHPIPCQLPILGRNSSMCGALINAMPKLLKTFLLSFSAILTANCFTYKFNVRGMEWTPETLTLLLDGKEMNTIEVSKAGGQGIPNPFQQKVFIIINQALGGTNGGDPSHTTFPLDYLIDYVRVYSGTPSPAPPSPPPAPTPVDSKVACMHKCEADAKTQSAKGCCEFSTAKTCSWKASAWVEGGQSEIGAFASNCYSAGTCDGWNDNEKCSGAVSVA